MRKRAPGVAVTLMIVLAGLGLAPAPALAAVLVNGTPTAGWGVDGRVYATVVVGDVVVVGGKFANAVSPSGSTLARKNLAAFSLSSGNLLTGWRTNAGGPVRAMVTDGTSVWLGGAFTRVGGRIANRLGKVDVATGEVRPFSASVDSSVRALALKGGSLYAGGAFLNANGAPRTRLAKFSAATGALDESFKATANNTVFGLAANPVKDALYVSGPFTTLSSGPRNGVGAVSEGSGSLQPIVFGSAARPTLGLATNTDGTRLFGAGGSGSNSAAAWDTSDVSPGKRIWRQVADGDIQAIAYHDGTVYFGFHDGYQADTTLKLLAANADTGRLQSFYPRFDGFWGIFAIAVNDQGLVAGGEFTTVSGVRARGFARFMPADVPPQEPVVEVFLNAQTLWRYWDADSRPEGWQAFAFDDATWKQGLTQLGYGDGDEATVINSGPTLSSRPISSYYRATFSVDRIPTLCKLELLADDGAVVYLNGVQVLRDNMPSGTITHSTLASSTRSGGPENALRPFSINPERLRVGQNVLSVEIHQDSASTVDSSFDAELTGEY